MAALAVNGTQIEVPHMHFFRYDAEGRVTDLLIRVRRHRNACSGLEPTALGSAGVRGPSPERLSRLPRPDRLDHPPTTKTGVKMAVGIRIKFAGLTQEQFDAINAHIDPDSNPPKGLLFHASGPIDEGWGVIDFWESRSAFDEFQGRIQQAAAASGVEMQGHPDVKEFPVHETFPR
jgi:hypothetical protein